MSLFLPWVLPPSALLPYLTQVVRICHYYSMRRGEERKRSCILHNAPLPTKPAYHTRMYHPLFFFPLHIFHTVFLQHIPYHCCSVRVIWLNHRTILLHTMTAFLFVPSVLFTVPAVKLVAVPFHFQTMTQFRVSRCYLATPFTHFRTLDMFIHLPLLSDVFLYSFCHRVPLFGLPRLPPTKKLPLVHPILPHYPIALI